MKRTTGFLLSAAGLILAADLSAAGLRYPPRPGKRQFIVDEADLIKPEHEQEIRSICDKLLTEKAVPIIVVTIRSMAEYGAAGWDIRVYAQNLFNTWGIGFKKWNHGILLLISKGDRKARIELGSDWRHKKDDECSRIMNESLIPSFKAGDFSGGILLAVKGLDAMARDLKIPTRPRPWWHYLLVLLFFGLLAFTVISLIRRGSSGWAWLFWGVVLSILGYLLYQALTSSSRGGGYSGGSFGGGFSGGGGATGSW